MLKPVYIQYSGGAFRDPKDVALWEWPRLVASDALRRVVRAALAVRRSFIDTPKRRAWAVEQAIKSGAADIWEIRNRSRAVMDYVVTGKRD